MRLTLRTLLAYMDGLLEPKDSQEIGKKIEESKFATDLFHKIRDVMRRLRLAAPSVTERGANLDCNTVAEYLDNALPADRVPDFEEVCLKSEMHLAEVASAHQILTMVLGEPAEIEPESRQRMYQLPTVAHRVDEERLAAAEAANVLSGDGHAPAPPSPPAPPVKVRPRPVVPDYLRDPPKKRRLLPAAAVTFFACAAIVLVLWALGQLNPGTPIGDFLQRMSGKQVMAKNDDNGAHGDDGATAASGSQSSGSSSQASGTGTGTSATGASGSGSATGPAGTGSGPSNSTPANSAHPGGPSSEPPLPVLTPPAPDHALDEGMSQLPVLVPPGESPAKSSGSGPAASGTIVSGPPIVPVEPPKAQIQTVPPNGPVGPALSGSNSVAALPKPPQPGLNEMARVDNAPKGPKPSQSGNKEIAPAPTPPVVDEKSKVARFTSDGQDVLLKFDPRTAIWRRVLPEEFITANQTLLSLPTYRSRIDIFDIGATLELLNGTRVDILPGSPQAPPGVDVDYGRLVMKPLAQAGARLRLVAGSHSGIITLANVETIAALEVTRIHDPGTDPEKVLSHALSKLYVARGSATWEEGDRPAVRLSAPAQYQFDGAKAETLGAADVPKWIATNIVSDAQQRAAADVSQALPAERSASLSLMELTESRRSEDRDLAARCLGYLGQFDPLTSALNDADYRVKWPDYFDELKDAIARGPETASGIRQTLEKQYGNDSAAELYRMLWGYTDKQLESGEDARLVKNLDNEGLVFRVLAFCNLKDIAHKTLNYHPELTAAKRLTSVQRWKQEEKAGHIRWSPAEPKGRPSLPAAPLPPTSNPNGEVPGGVPDSVNPAGATEPINGPNAGRPAVVVPEPDPSSGDRPKVVYPEPDTKDMP